MDLSFFFCTRTPRLRRFLAALVLPAVIAAAAGSAQAQDGNDKVIQQSKETVSESKQRIGEKAAERKQLQELAEEATASVDVAQATADDLIAALEAVRASVNAQQEAADNAARAVAETVATEADALERIAALEEDLAAAKQSLHDAVIQSYVTFQTPEGSLSVLGNDPWDNARLEALVGFATGSRIDDIDELRRLGAELERWRTIAEEATDAARLRQEQADELLTQLYAAQDREAEFVLEAEERLETRLYEVQTLRAFDASLAAEIEREERRIAQALEQQRAAEAARQRAQERAEREAAAAAQAAVSETVTVANADFTLVWVRGFQVNSELADQTAGLVDAMAAEGFRLEGWGYRTHQSQISLRRAHCGSTPYAIWEMPASRCRPPTARPGRSNHERGLAIDFTYNGRIISSRGSAVFQALQRIAPRFGFKNLPSEPWHWSVDGR